MNNETRLWEALVAQAWLDCFYTRAQVLRTAIEHRLDFDEIQRQRDEMAGES